MHSWAPRQPITETNSMFVPEEKCLPLFTTTFSVFFFDVQNDDPVLSFFQVNGHVFDYGTLT